MTLASNALIGRTVLHMLDAGYRVELHMLDAGGLYLYAWPAEQDRPDKVNYWIAFAPENEEPCDVIHDFTMNLEKTLKPVLDYATTLQALFTDKD